MEEPPIIDMKCYLNKTEGWEIECKKVIESFHKFGICIVRDPRVSHEVNDDYIDMVERYFEEVSDEYYRGGTLEDMH